MTVWSDDFVGQDFRELPHGCTLGEAVRLLVRKRDGLNAAKKIEARWDIDPKTARNVVSQGNCSERTLAKAIHAEGWSLLDAIGKLMTGQTYAEWEEARLNQIIVEARSAQDRIEQLRLRAALLAESADQVNEAALLPGGHAPSADRGESRATG